MMKFKTTLLISLTLMLSLSSYAAGQWKLIRSDEFNSAAEISDRLCQNLQTKIVVVSKP